MVWLPQSNDPTDLPEFPADGAVKTPCQTPPECPVRPRRGNQGQGLGCWCHLPSQHPQIGWSGTPEFLLTHTETF